MGHNILDTDLTYLSGVGEKRATSLAKDLGLRSYRDLLLHYPYKYIDRSRIYRISELTRDMPYIQLQGIIHSFEELGTGRKKRLVATLQDASGEVELMWFRGISTMPKLYKAGKVYLVFGKPSFFNGKFTLTHPEIDDMSKFDVVAGGLVPLYRTSEKMKNSGLSNRQLRLMQYNLLKLVYNHLEEPFNEELRQRFQLMPYQEAMMEIHFPSTAKKLEEARRRLKFEELLFIQLKLQSLKLQRKANYQGFIFEQVGESFNKLYKEVLPFDLTNAQKRVVKEIRADVLTGQQMNRLVQGDVGSGKTLVALLSMLLAVDNGYQACMMAPTEILARQHHAGLKELLDPLGISVELLVGSTKKKERNYILPALANGEIKIIIGTHALIEDTVQFDKLGIAVIDEQHRFGVAQRSRLWTKNNGILPHILIMSATPIPRTLAMTLYGDLDVSVIDEMPPGRKAIDTRHHYDGDMAAVYNFIRQQVAEGRQVYVVYPMIEESEGQDLKDLESGFERYTKVFPEYNIEMVHGKLKAKEKDERMQNFISGKAQLLLATTVIEVGVNVPNASVMIIESANRFGLSQLHQLRGRVGRGAAQSYCILLSGYQLSSDARRRLDIMVETNDGFEIAEEDMRLRGFGELEGTRQSGQELSLKIANPMRDVIMLEFARSVAEEILNSDPQLEKPHNEVLRRRLQTLYSDFANWGVIS